ncbi:MAG: tRNA lysidine(34) synthetase TilS [Anaerolineae bacterium]|nr:tRNA lysidine(34) synthetase TilS [Anaerolineae bacterium]
MQNRLVQVCRIDSSEPVVAGVSGGADSLAMLDGMLRCGYDVIVTHLNHGIRAQAAEDAQFVQDFAARRNLPYISAEVDVPALARRERRSLEEAARRARYAFLFQVAEEHHAQAVAVGHNADDQVETVLMHLLQGSGLEGLAGMKARLQPNPWHPTIALVRPLLAFWRSEIEAHCAEMDLTPVADLTNQDPAYLRNRIRLELLPLLQAMQPAVKTSILRLAEISSEDAVYLDEQVSAAWRNVLDEAGETWLRFDRDRLLDQSPAIQKRLLRRAFQCLAPTNRELDWRAVQTASDFLQAPTRTGGIGLPGRLRAWLEGDAFYIARSGATDLPHTFPQLALANPTLLPAAGFVDLDGGWRLHIESCAGERLPVAPSDPRHAWLDADALDHPLALRNPLPGDRFHPLGMARPMRLSDFWVNQRVPARLRARFPLVVCGDRIVWIPGLRVAEWAKATANSTRILCIIIQTSIEG